jgi:putative transposase
VGKPYSDDLGECGIAAIEAGHTRVKVAEIYNIALSTVGGFIKRKRETGSVIPDKFGGYKTFTLELHADRVKELVAQQPDSTLAELQVRLAKEKVKLSQSGISRFLHHINLTFKKKGLQGIEWVILGDHSAGSMHVRTLRRRYSSSRSPYAHLWKTRILLLRPSTNPSETLFSGLQ